MPKFPLEITGLVDDFIKSLNDDAISAFVKDLQFAHYIIQSDNKGLVEELTLYFEEDDGEEYYLPLYPLNIGVKFKQGEEKIESKASFVRKSSPAAPTLAGELHLNGLAALYTVKLAEKLKNYTTD